MYVMYVHMYACMYTCADVCEERNIKYIKTIDQE